jgi:predicted amidohydrolase YtcJ
MRLRRLLVLLLTGCGSREEPAADLVIRNATIFSGIAADTTIPHGSVAVSHGRITYLGPDSGVTRLIGSRSEVIDAGGGLLLPGFIDSHVHSYSGTELLECDLGEDSIQAQLLVSIQRCADARPEAAWVRGTGWALPVFADANPTAALLDQVVSSRPAYLVAADGHSAWVNSKALAMAGLGPNTPDPVNGRIERDRRGIPTGTLRESAMELVGRLIPPYTVQDHLRGFQRAFEEATSYGITAIVDAEVDSTMLEAYRLLDSAGSLPVRVTVAQSLGSGLISETIERVQRFRDHYRSRLISANSAKIYMDGVMEARTAAMLTPYLDRPGDRGEPGMSQERLDSLVLQLDRAGVQIHVHAIGDRAIRMTLDALEQAGKTGPTRNRRHQIAHLELIDPADIPRFKALSVIANFQPLWAYDDSYIVDLTIPGLGPARSRWLYPIQSVFSTGATVVAGSDWSVSSMNPLEGIQVAVTRRALEAGPGEGWIPQERATLREMLLAYTINGAYARFADSTTGSLEVGKLADLVLLDRNLFELPAHQISQASVVVTVMDGRVRYRKPSP